MRTNKSQRLTLVQGGAGVGDNGYVCTISGCESHVGITLPLTSKEAQLSELLSDLERRVETLESKYLEVLDTLTTDILPRVERLRSIQEMDTTKQE